MYIIAYAGGACKNGRSEKNAVPGLESSRRCVIIRIGKSSYRVRGGGRLDDARIIKLYRERCEEALKQTEEKYGGLIFSVAFRILASAADSEECVNDVLLKAWRSVPETEIGSLSAYLTKLARNAAIDRLKRRTADKRGAGETALILGELEECIPAPHGGDELSDDVSIRELLGRFVKTLSAEDRAVFLDRYFRALSIRETAEKHGSSEGRIAMRLSRRRKKLKRMLEKEDIRV